jgi:tRNA 2-thiouridine synthesizing protein A
MTRNDDIVLLDTCGLLCPLPVLKARKRLQNMQSGAVLRVLADDPAAMVDFPHFCTEQGHDLLASCEPEPGTLSFDIRKAG